MLFIFTLLLLTLTVNSEPSLRTCEPIRVEMCKNFGYNMTGMPNLGGNDLQQEANYCLKTFDPLIQYGCSKHLKLFLCSVYVPMCTEKVENPIGPCRGLCENVYTKCIPVLENFGFSWPEALNCTRFPIENNHEHMCMEGPRDMISDNRAPIRRASSSLTNCPPNQIREESNGNCISTCNGEHLFNLEEKKFAEVWISSWAVVCFASSLGAALTICIGGGRVRARPLISLALCYCFISAGWGLRMLTGRTTTICNGSNTSGEQSDDDGLSNANCAFVFLLIYYFGMASNAWWVSLCACWFAKAGLSLTPEKLKNLGSFLHVAAWGLPAAQTVVALVRRDVDSDSLTGTCYVGNQDNVTLLTLVIIPQAIYLSLGIVLLILGSIYVIKRPQLLSAAPLTGVTPRKHSDILGALSTLYVIPTACVFASYCYEYNNRNEWLYNNEKPALWAFLLRYLMSFFVGVSMIFYIWSSKSWQAWKSVFKRFEPRKQPLPVKCQTLSVVRYAPSNHSHVTAPISNSSRHSSASRTYPHRKLRVHHHRTTSENII